MRNLTLTIDEAVLRRARIRALQEGTSVNAVVRSILAEYAASDAGSSAVIDDFLTLAGHSTASSGAGGRTWRRDELYDRFNTP